MSVDIQTYVRDAQQEVGRLYASFAGIGGGRHVAGSVKEFQELVARGELATFSPSPYMLVASCGPDLIDVIQIDRDARALVVTSFHRGGEVVRKSIEPVEQGRYRFRESDLIEGTNVAITCAAGNAVAPAIVGIAALLADRFRETFPEGVPEATGMQRRVPLSSKMSLVTWAGTPEERRAPHTIIRAAHPEDLTPEQLEKGFSPEYEISLESDALTGKIEHFVAKVYTFGPFMQDFFPAGRE